MMDYITIALGLLIALILLQARAALATLTKRLPPGPTPLPIIGNLHILSGRFYRTMTDLADKYGPIMTLKLGSVTTIVVSSPTIAREILQKQDASFTDKRVPDGLRAHNHDKYSIAWMPYTPQWRTVRKLLATNIMTNNRLGATTHLRHNKVRDLMDYCRKCSKTGEAVDVGQAAFGTTLNMMSNTIFSKDIADYYSDSAREFKNAVWHIMYEPGKPNLVDFFPILKRLDPQGIRRRMKVHIGKVVEIFDGLLNQRLEERRLHGAKNIDALDEFLKYLDEHNDIDSNNVKHACLDLFIGGTDTTTHATEWAVAELIKNPESMKKLKKELDEVVGKGKQIQETDIPNLPYLNCIMKETLRLHPPGPFLLPRKPERDVEVCGYTIPRDSQVLVNIWALGHDPKLWEDPWLFRPERFENSNIDYRGHHFELLPFGSGRRNCPGLPLAVKMSPLMVGSLINSFDWKLDGDKNPAEMNMEEEAGVGLQMLYPIRAVPIAI